MKKHVCFIGLATILTLLCLTSFKTQHSGNGIVGQWQVLEFSITNHEDDRTEYTSEGWWEFKSNGYCRGEFPQFPRLGLIEARYDLDGNELTINWRDGEDEAVIKVFINISASGRLSFSGTINLYERGVLDNKIPISTSGKLKRKGY